MLMRLSAMAWFMDASPFPTCLHEALTVFTSPTASQLHQMDSCAAPSVHFRCVNPRECDKLSELEGA